MKKQLLGLTGQLMSIEKEVTMLMERAVKVGSRGDWASAAPALYCYCTNSCTSPFPAASGAASSESAPSSVQWDETSGLSEPEHAGGDDAWVSGRRTPRRFIFFNLTFIYLFYI